MSETILKSEQNLAGEPIRLMEVCGTHTMAIAKSGIKQLLPANVRLLSGPGCPVCVTPPEVIDAVLKLTEMKAAPQQTNLKPETFSAAPILTTYGDMIRVPGSVRGDSLMRRKAMGADVRIVYSPLDTVQIARDNPEREVIFLGVGFETSAPGTAAAIETASRENLSNFSVFSMLKMLEPSIRALAADPEFKVQGFLCPGHVAVIIGERGMRFFSDDLHFPAVISGFETEDLLKSITLLLRQIRSGKAVLENEYSSVVLPEGNVLAQETIDRVFEPRDDTWRGLGMIPLSGYQVRETFAAYDAERKFDIRVGAPAGNAACRCGDVIRGMLDPQECPLFGTVCVPDDPEGPCMVSSEGACAAEWKYR
jgi:hydrogenase expression/formation protein HypD